MLYPLEPDNCKPINSLLQVSHDVLRSQPVYLKRSSHMPGQGRAAKAMSGRVTTAMYWIPPTTFMYLWCFETVAGS